MVAAFEQSFRNNVEHWFGRATRSGPVHIQTDPPTAPLFQLETRSASRSNGCFSAGLDGDLGLGMPTHLGVLWGEF